MTDVKIKRRINWIDTIKAICIFAVMYNHQPFSDNWLRVDYFFLVGFFFCSGLTFDMQKGLKYRLVRIADSLIIPYFLLSFISFFLYFNKVSALIRGNIHPMLEYGYDVFLGHYAWFVPCLIVVELIYALSTWLKISHYVAFVSVIIYLTGALNGLAFPWHVDTAMYAILFFHTGYILKSPLFSSDLKIDKVKGLYSIVYVMIAVYLYTSINLLQSYPFSTSINQFNNEGLILIMNYLGIAFLVLVSQRITTNKYLNYLGKNTLSIFFLHVPFVYYIYQVIAKFVDLSSPWINNSITGLIYVFLISLVLYPLVLIINKSKTVVGKGHVVENIVYHKIRAKMTES